MYKSLEFDFGLEEKIDILFEKGWKKLVWFFNDERLYIVCNEEFIGDEFYYKWICLVLEEMRININYKVM